MMSVADITYNRDMSRWEPNARGRLEQAALELYCERGFDQTTVTEISERAGLTERTFFRYFADKREVLFWGQEHLRDLYVRAIVAAPETDAPIDLVAAAHPRGPRPAQEHHCRLVITGIPIDVYPNRSVQYLHELYLLRRGNASPWLDDP